jgi:hypothetical protein
MKAIFYTDCWAGKDNEGDEVHNTLTLETELDFIPPQELLFSFSGSDSLSVFRVIWHHEQKLLKVYLKNRSYDMRQHLLTCGWTDLGRRTVS